jgi:hypothetical protein
MLKLPVVKLADPLANGVPLKGSPEELKIAQLNPAGESLGSTQRPAEKELIVDGLESVNESETASTPVMECGFSVPLIGPLSYRTVSANDGVTANMSTMIRADIDTALRPRRIFILILLLK